MQYGMMELGGGRIQGGEWFLCSKSLQLNWYPWTRNNFKYIDAKKHFLLNLFFYHLGRVSKNKEIFEHKYPLNIFLISKFFISALISSEPHFTTSLLNLSMLLGLVKGCMMQISILNRYQQQLVFVHLSTISQNPMMAAY